MNSEDFKHENTSIAKELQDKFYLIFGKYNFLIILHFHVPKFYNYYLLIVLFLGICTEAICNQRTLENLDNFITCLKSLYTILDSPLARQMMMKNSILAVETLNIMHK